MNKVLSRRKGRQAVVIALGGNALLRSQEKPTLEKQFRNAQNAMENIAKVTGKYNIVITHGNGPQVGAIVIRSEMAAQGMTTHSGASVRPYPIDLSTAVAESEGELGYIIEQSLYNELTKKKPVVSVLTQVLVDKNDKAFKNPSKPVGPFYTKKQAQQLKKKGLHVIDDSGRGWRRVVASPQPKKIVEACTIKKLTDSRVIVIAAGGGGIPVIKEKSKHKSHYHLRGIDAVIDKDRASALLAKDINADMLIMLTGVDSVKLNYNTKHEKSIKKMTKKEALHYKKQGHFAEGSMGPKIEAALDFIKSGGQKVIITSPDKLERALHGKDGTLITDK